MQENASSYFNLESPPSGAELPAGRHQLRGWLVPKPAAHFVDIRARVGPREFAGAYGFPRVDLAAHFAPSRPWLPAEFLIDVDFIAGPVEVQIEALDLTGQWLSIHCAHFLIRADASTTPAPATLDPISAMEFGRALQILLVSNAETKEAKSATAIAAELPYPRIIRSDHLPFHGYIAEPAGITPALYGQMEVVAWLFHETQPIRRAFVTTDLLTFQPLEIGGVFAGVAARFPGHANAHHCRLSGFVDVSTHFPSPASVRIFAELADGSVHLCLANHCRPLTTEELKKTSTPISLWRFWQSWNGLKQALITRGVELDPVPALRAGFWESLGHCRQMTAPGKPNAAPATRPLPQAATNRKLRLLLITHNLNFEGAPLLFVEYARHLVEKCGAEISVLSGQDGPLRQFFESVATAVTVVDINAQSPSELSHKIEVISRRLSWDQIDLVVANTLASFWGVTLAHAAGRPSLLYIHESTSPAAFFRKTTPQLLPVVYQAFRRATAVSFNTSATQVYYATLGSGNNFHLNPAWIDLTALEKFRMNHDRNSLRAPIGLASNELLVANIGTVCERKGQHDFLRAVERLWQCAPALAARCRFVMVGGRDTRYNQSLRKNLAALGRPNIEIIAETSKAFDYFGAADLFVCTSYEESFPRVVLEAMAFALPIVSTNVHGIPYMLHNETEAILTHPGDIAALTSGMLRLLENPAEARALATRAHQRVPEFAAATVLPRHADFTSQVAALSA